MFAHKLRRDEDYVVRPQPVAERSGPTAISATAAAVPSPARMMQDDLAAQIAGGVLTESDRGLSPRARIAAIIGAALMCWIPIAGAIMPFFS